MTPEYHWFIAGRNGTSNAATSPCPTTRRQNRNRRNQRRCAYGQFTLLGSAAATAGNGDIPASVLLARVLGDRRSRYCRRAPGYREPRPMRRPSPLTIALLLLGACGREQPERADRVATAAVPGRSAPASVPVAAAAQDTAFRGTTEAIHRPRAAALPQRTETLRALDATAHAGFDRIVFEFAGDSVPGYHVEYAKRPVVRCGSGDPVPLAGTARLVVRFEPAQAHDELGNSTVPERERTLKLPAVT